MNDNIGAKFHCSRGIIYASKELTLAEKAREEAS
jgi:hypothetical protein